MEQNAIDSRSRRYILVQVAEPIGQETAAFKAGYENIAALAKEQVRRAGDAVKAKSPLTTQELLTGFRVRTPHARGPAVPGTGGLGY